MTSGRKRTFGPFLAARLSYKWDPQITHHNTEGDPAFSFLGGAERYKKEKRKGKQNGLVFQIIDMRLLPLKERKI